MYGLKVFDVRSDSQALVFDIRPDSQALEIISTGLDICCTDESSRYFQKNTLQKIAVRYVLNFGYLIYG